MGISYLASYRKVQPERVLWLYPLRIFLTEVLPRPISRAAWAAWEKLNTLPSRCSATIWFEYLATRELAAACAQVFLPPLFQAGFPLFPRLIAALCSGVFR